MNIILAACISRSSACFRWKSRSCLRSNAGAIKVRTTQGELSGTLETVDSPPALSGLGRLGRSRTAMACGSRAVLTVCLFLALMSGGGGISE